MKRRLLYLISDLLSFVPDKIMLKIQYKIRTGRNLNLDNPMRFSEKMQHYKAFYRNPIMKMCVDKYDVRKFVTEKLGTDVYLNELYQLCNNAEEINFQRLPSRFVIKTTDGGSGDNVFICRDKNSLELHPIVRTVNSWKKKKYATISREWAYDLAKGSRIIVEKYLEDDSNADGSIDDYKFFCYNGKFYYLWVDKNRYSNHTRCFYDQNLKWIKGIDSDYPHSDVEFNLPQNICEMIPLAEKLSEDFPFARIDFYNIKGKIVFGEITFYPMSGYGTFCPDSFDYDLGQYFDTDSYGRFDRRKMLS